MLQHEIIHFLLHATHTQFPLPSIFYTFDDRLTKFNLLAKQREQNERYNIKNKEVTAL